MPVDGQPARTQAAHRGHGIVRHELGGVAHAHEDLEEDREGDEGHLGRVGQAQQHQQNRQQDDFGHGVEQVEDGGQDPVGLWGPAQNQADGHGRDGPDGQAQGDAVEANPEGRRDGGHVLGNHGHGGQGRGQGGRVDGQGGQVPAEQDDEDGDQVAEGLFGDGHRAATPSARSAPSGDAELEGVAWLAGVAWPAGASVVRPVTPARAARTWRQTA